jgi:3-phenylpropionate/trans-cinnamate dioxygenase ferredoxin reductase subunit
MITTEGTIAIVGAGPAAATAADVLRKHGFDGQLMVIGDEEAAPYQRPPLSKGFLAGTLDAEKLNMFPPEWEKTLRIERIKARASRLDPTSRSIVCDTGQVVSYSSVLIATGVSARKPSFATGERVFTLRSLPDARGLSEYMKPGAKLLVIGAGFIGCEVAATATKLGVEVTIIESTSGPMSNVLGADLRAMFTEIHRENGVKFIFDDQVTDITEGLQGVFAATRAGRRIEADAVLVCIGSIPNVSFLDESGIAIKNGILVDSFCRSSEPQVYAAGDVANHDHPLFGRLRVEHHDNALRQATAAAKNMLGISTPYSDVHWIWSDQYEFNLQIAGSLTNADRAITRGSLDGRSVLRIYLRGDNTVQGALGINRGRDIAQLRRLVASRTRFDDRLLHDEEIALKDAILSA